MSRGRRPLPTKIKNLRGNPGKRPLNENEPETVAGDPVMPAHLSARAKAEWERMLPILRTMGVLTPADGPAFAAYCMAHDICAIAYQDICENGPNLREPIMGRKGTIDENTIIDHRPKKNPATGVLSEYTKIKKSFLVEFGCTPASRGKLHVEKEKPKDAADTYFAKKDPDSKHIN